MKQEVLELECRIIVYSLYRLSSFQFFGSLALRRIVLRTRHRSV